jgi:hypothetical protein
LGEPNTVNGLSLEIHDKIPYDFGGRRRMVRWVRFAAGALLLSSLFVFSPIIPIDLRSDVPIFSQVLPQVEPVEANATCAQGGECIVGNTGPGGGIVFYVAPTTFACGATLASTCKYLEAAPTSGTAAWTDATYAWSGNTNIEIGVAAQGTAVGTGLKNTLAMETDATRGANRAGTKTRDYRGPNSLTDWYLPSKDELNELCKYARTQTTGDTAVRCADTGTLRVGFNNAAGVGLYWSSTETGPIDGLGQQFGVPLEGDIAIGAQGGKTKSQATTINVRPVRAFAADTTKPTASVTTATVGAAGNAVAQSNELGKLFLVKSNNTPTSVEQIIALPANERTAPPGVNVATINTDTNLPAAMLTSGTYKVYAADIAGNLSVASTNTVTIDAVSPTVGVAPIFAPIISNTSRIAVQSSETGTAYLVKSTVTVTNVASITSAADADFNSVTITAASTDTSLATTGLNAGSYVVYAADAVGNLSMGMPLTATIGTDSAAPTLTAITPIPGETQAGIASNLILRFNEPVAKGNDAAKTISLVRSVVPTITNGSLATNVATLTFSSNPGFVVGDKITTTGCSNTAFNVTGSTNEVGTVGQITAVNGSTVSFAKTNENIASAALTDCAYTATKTDGTTNLITTSEVIGSNSSKLVIGSFPNDNRATLNPAGEMLFGVAYHVLISAGAIVDKAATPNPFAAISSTTFWSFTTGTDTVAPTLNGATSDPPNGMATFTPTRNIVLKFSEPVVDIANKFIKLCTGAVNCATPVQTFTLQTSTASNGLVTVSDNTVTLNPTADLNFSTTYFVLIEEGAFTDGTGNQFAGIATCAAHPCTYEFSTSAAPVAGGGGAPTGGAPTGGTPTGGTPVPITGSVPATCGPPPLPPCNVGPGINFGPGNVIQNPNALSGSDMANLRPDNFVGFRPDDARSLGAGALQNFQPTQFGALPPAAMAGFDRNQISNLNPAAMAGMNREQMAALPPTAMAGFNANQMAALPPSAMAGFDPTRVAALPPTAMAGFNANQMGQLPPAAMAGFDPTRMAALPPTAMTGFKADQFAALPANAMSGFKPDQMAALPPTAMTAMKLDQFKVLPPTAMTGFKPDQMAALPTSVMAGFDPTRMAALPANAMSGFKADQFAALPANAMSGFKPDQFAALPPAAMTAMKLDQFKVLPPTAMTGFKPDQMSALSTSVMAGFDPTRMAALPPIAMGGFKPEQFAVLPPTAMTGFKPEQMAALPPTAMTAMKLDQFKVLPPTAITGFKPDQFAALPAAAMIGFKPDQFAALPADAISGMQQNQLKVIPANVMKAFTATQMDSMPVGALAVMSPSQFKALSPAVVASMSPEQRSALPKQALNPAANTAPTNVGDSAALAGALTGWNVDKVPATAFAGFGSADAAKLSPQVFSSLKPAQFQAMPPAAFTAIKPSQVGALPSDVLATLTSQQLASMPAAALGSLNTEQFAAMPAAAFGAMKPAQVGAMTPTLISTMTPQQVGALPPTAIAGLKADQVEALPVEAISTLKPKQVAGLKPKAAAGFSVEKLAALTPAQEKALKPAFINALSAEQKAALNS